MKPLLAVVVALSLLAACSRGGGDARAGAAGNSNDGAGGAWQPGAPAAGGADAPRGARGNGPLPPGSVQVQPVTIMDPTGMAQPMPASFGLIPVGWQTRGAGIVWGRQYACTNGYNVEWSAGTPDGSTGVAVLPMIRWESNNYGAPSAAIGCPQMPFTSLQQLLVYVAGQYKRGAQPIQYRARPDLGRRFAYLNMSVPSPAGRMDYWVEAGDLLFGFQENGRNMRGLLSTVAVFQSSRATYAGGLNMNAMSAATMPGFMAIAPDGALDFQLVEAIRQSFVPNPEWELAIAKHNNAIAGEALRETEKRAAIWREANDYISKLRQDTYAARQRSEDYISRERGKGIRGVEEYADAGAPGGTVELSSYYDHAFALRDGTYLLTTDPNFDPWRDAGLDARKLEPAR